MRSLEGSVALKLTLDRAHPGFVRNNSGGVDSYRESAGRVGANEVQNLCVRLRGRGGEHPDLMSIDPSRCEAGWVLRRPGEVDTDDVW